MQSLTQDRTRLIDVSNVDVYIAQENKHIFNICIYNFNHSVVLGTYTTEEQAKRVLNFMVVWLGDNGYYKMPEIDNKTE